jgi:hypothetical protein
MMVNYAKKERKERKEGWREGGRKKRKKERNSEVLKPVFAFKKVPLYQI